MKHQTPASAANASEPALSEGAVAALTRMAVRQGHQPHLTVISRSMTPLLRVGDQVVVADRPIAPGDIVIVDTGDFLLTHRLVSVENGTVITRGDHILRYDSPYDAAAVVGKVVGRIRNGEMMSLIDGCGGRLNRRLWRVTRWEGKLIGRIPFMLLRIVHKLTRLTGRCLMFAAC